MDVRSETCPSCQATLTVDSRYRAWCPSCNWGLKAAEPTLRPTIRDRIYLRLGARFGRRLHREILRGAIRRPRFNPSLIVAFVLAALVYVLAIGLLAIGLLFIRSSQLSPVPIVLGVLFVGLAWLMRPRIPRLDEPTLGREDLPRVFAMLDRLTEAARTSRVERVLISPAYNAGWGRVGVRRQGVLEVGLPLWAAMEPQERVWLLGHELGHDRNGDPMRGFFLRSATGALVELYDAIAPETLFGEGSMGVLAFPFRLLQLGLARTVLAWLYAMLLVAYLDTQRAEYYADALGAGLAGRDASIAAIARLHASDSIARMTWLGGTADPIGAIVDRVRDMPASEVERIERMERLDGSRLDYDHPPTAFRLEAIRAQPLAPPGFVFSGGESDMIDTELARFRQPLGRKIVDGYLASIGH